MNEYHGEVLLPGGAESRGRVSRALRHVGLWISVVLIAAVGALSYFNIRDLIDERAAAERTQAVLREIELLTSHVKDAETGQRGFLITGDEDFLGPHRSAVLAAPASVARLRRAIDGNGNGGASRNGGK